MPSIINAATSGGLISTADTSGVLQLQTASTNALSINASQQVQVNTGGSASTPVISKSDDTNTGIFFPAADTIAFSEGGTESMRITSTGRVLIGSATSPSGSAVLQTLVGGPSGGASTGLQMIYNASTFGGGAIFASETGGGLQFYTVTGNIGSETYFEKMSILQTGNILSLVGGSKTATGTGIAFPATQSASSDANTLDDYEEGTWTPVLGGSTTDPTSVTYAGQTGTYTKIGRQVTIGFNLIFSTYTGGSGNLYVKGLPFSAAGGINQQQGSLVIELVTLGSGRTAIVCALSQGSNFLRLFQYGSANAYEDTLLTQAPSSGSNKYIQGTITYFTA